MKEKGWRQLTCDIVQTAYDQVANLYVVNFKKIKRVDNRGRHVVVTPAGRIQRVRETLSAAAWLASSRCVLFTSVAGFHPSRLWKRPEWQEHIHRMLGYLDDRAMKGKYDQAERHLVEECLERYERRP